MKTQTEIEEYIKLVCPTLSNSDIKDIGNVDYFETLIGPADIKTAARKLARIHRVLSILNAITKARRAELEEKIKNEELSVLNLIYQHQKQIRSGLFPLEDKELIEEHATYYLTNQEGIENVLKDKNACVDKTIISKLLRQHITSLDSIRYTSLDITKYTSIDITTSSDMALKKAAEVYVQSIYGSEFKDIHVQDRLLSELLLALRTDINTVNQLSYTVSQEQKRIIRDDNQDISKF